MKEKACLTSAGLKVICPRLAKVTFANPSLIPLRRAKREGNL